MKKSTDKHAGGDEQESDHHEETPDMSDGEPEDAKQEELSTEKIWQPILDALMTFFFVKSV